MSTIRATDPSPARAPQSVVIQDDAPRGDLWSYFNFYLTAAAQAFFLPPGNRRVLKCSAGSYSQVMDDLHRVETDRQVHIAYLRKALETLPLDVLLSNAYFWCHENLDLICSSLAGNAPKFRQLVQLTPPEKYSCLPGHCTTKLQIEILLDEALGNPAKLEQLTDIILTMIGDPRNGDDLDALYYFYLELLICRKGSDSYAAERIRTCRPLLAPEQIQALKKNIKTPLIAKELETISPGHIR